MSSKDTNETLQKLYEKMKEELEKKDNNKYISLVVNIQKNDNFASLVAQWRSAVLTALMTDLSTENMNKDSLTFPKHILATEIITKQINMQDKINKAAIQILNLGIVSELYKSKQMIINEILKHKTTSSEELTKLQTKLSELQSKADAAQAKNTADTAEISTLKNKIDEAERKNNEKEEALYQLLETLKASSP